MTYIEPAVLETDFRGDSVRIDPSSTQLGIRRWSPGQVWIFNKLIDDEYQIINSGDVSEKIQREVEELYADLRGIDPDIVDELVGNITERMTFRATDSSTVVAKSNVLILTTDVPGHMFLVSNNKENIDNLLSELDRDIGRISDIASDFGMDINLTRSKELAEGMSETLSGEVINRKDFDNELEELVYNDVRENLTASLDGNVVLRFGDEDPETFEYDILIHLNPLTRVVIEVKDESHEEANLGKIELVDRPRDKTSIIEPGQTPRVPSRRLTNDRTECFVIVRGIDGNKFKQHQKKAHRRDINLTKWDSDGEYIEQIEDSLKRIVAREAGR